MAGCLAALCDQVGSDTQVIVVSTIEPPSDLVERHPSVEWLDANADALIPHLWQIGIDAASRDVVAITTAHFVPAANWVAQIRDAHRRLASPAIGGAIDPPRGGRAGDWATYFLRYSPYLSWQEEQTVADVAGDNASYKRADLAAHRDVLEDGFWEQAFHRRVLAEGKTLAYSPAIRVTLRTSFGFARFCRQRLHHGRQFGRDRVQNCGAAERVARVVTAPLSPFVFLARIVGRVVRSGRDWAAFLYALPVLLCFLAAWSIGECWGYLSKQRRDILDAPGEERVAT